MSEPANAEAVGGVFATALNAAAAEDNQWHGAGSAHTTGEFRRVASSACWEHPPSAPAGPEMR